MKHAVAFTFTAIGVLLMLGWIVLYEERDDAHKSTAASAALQDDPHVMEPESGRLGTAQSTEAMRRPTAEMASEPAENAALSTVGSLVVQVTSFPGGLAENVHVIATARTDSWSNKMRFRRRTGADGRAVFPELPPGLFAVQTDRSPEQAPQDVEVLGGVEVELNLSLPAGLHVIGRVRDTSGGPIADAEIRLTSPTGGWTSDGVVGVSDAAGEFKIVDVPSGQSIGATATGYRPSMLVDMDERDPTEAPTFVELVLEPGGARLEGLVLGHDDKPVKGAVLSLGSTPRLPSVRIDGSARERWGPRATRTDEQGHFVLDGLEPGATVLRVRAAGYPTWFAEVSLEAGQSRREVVRLMPGATVMGRITDSAKRPASGVLVHALSESVNAGNLQNGLLTSTSPFHHPCTVTAEDGRFRLEGVAPGEIYLVVREQSPEHQRPRGPYRYLMEKVVLAPSQVLTWDRELSDGRVLEGTASYLDGKPIVNRYVILESDDPDDYRAQRMENGSFRFIQLPDKAFWVRVQMHSKPIGAREPQMQGVRPDSGPVQLIAEFPAPELRKPTEVRARFVDSADRVQGEPAMMLEALGQHNWINGQGQGGEWVFWVDEPGDYRPVVFDGDRVAASGPSFAVAGSERLDLGVLRSEQGASLILRFKRSAEHPPRDVRCALTVNGIEWLEPISLGARNEQRLDRLEPGPGAVRLIGGNVVNRRIAFHLAAGAETVVEIPLEPAAIVPYSIRWEEAPAGETMSFQFVDLGTGGVVDEFSTPDLHRYTSPVSWAARLPVGAYALEVDFSTLADRRVEFEVPSLDPNRIPTVTVD